MSVHQAIVVYTAGGTRVLSARAPGARGCTQGRRPGLVSDVLSATGAAAAVEWEMFLADAVVETHDRVVGSTYREAARTCEAQLGDETESARADDPG